MSSLVGGAFFPVEILPDWLRVISFLLPITHALEALRLSMLEGYSIATLWRPLTALAVMAGTMLPLGLWLFSYAVDHARREGTLMQY